MATQIQELYTDSVEDTGVVTRVYFHCVILNNGNPEWHYFGTVEADSPRQGFYVSAPFYEHGYVQFPRDNEYLDDAVDEYFELGVQAGCNREGLN